MHLLHHPGGGSLDLQSLSFPKNSPSSRVSYRPADLVSAVLLAKTDRRNDPTAFVQQLDFSPTFALVRGPPQPELPLRALPLPNTRPTSRTYGHGQASPPLTPPRTPTAPSTGLFNGKSSDPSSDDEASSECSTPRASSPVTSARTPTAPLTGLFDSKTSYDPSDDDDEASSECSTPRATTPVPTSARSAGQKRSRCPSFDHPNHDRHSRSRGPQLVA